jgi:hypothetical protein
MPSEYPSCLVYFAPLLTLLVVGSLLLWPLYRYWYLPRASARKVERLAREEAAGVPPSPRATTSMRYYSTPMASPAPSCGAASTNPQRRVGRKSGG